MLKLVLKRQPTVPLEAEVLTPDLLGSMKHEEVCSQTVYHGKRRYRLDEFFDVTGDGDEHISIEGDLNKVRWIGREMKSGSITVNGSVGMHLGSYMRGGQISVSGDASDWVGAEMRNGTICVGGNAGGQIGGGYRGSLSGMRNGTIVIGGDVGLEVGLRMRRGTIVVGGVARDFAGLQMKGGTIVLRKGAEIRTGAWMVRGTIIALEPIPLMPTFRSSGSYSSVFLKLLANHLALHDVQLPMPSEEGFYQRHSGDHSVPGQGEILVWTPS